MAGSSHHLCRLVSKFAIFRYHIVSFIPFPYYAVLFGIDRCRVVWFGIVRHHCVSFRIVLHRLITFNIACYRPVLFESEHNLSVAIWHLFISFGTIRYHSTSLRTVPCCFAPFGTGQHRLLSFRVVRHRTFLPSSVFALLSRRRGSCVSMINSRGCRAGSSRKRTLCHLEPSNRAKALLKAVPAAVAWLATSGQHIVLTLPLHFTSHRQASHASSTARCHAVHMQLAPSLASCHLSTFALPQLCITPSTSCSLKWAFKLYSKEYTCL
ncbi:unnamed protein product [Protopolystoma xenopodis]|uniref:Uncharacterized protein n=1 Tax=Protopolystoma xenopodis TaxID=117903 RepID=A0A448WXU2_9PLAT|nr:unnamed protein product [Protopolystoma xenopodis]